CTTRSLLVAAPTVRSTYRFRFMPQPPPRPPLFPYTTLFRSPDTRRIPSVHCARPGTGPAHRPAGHPDDHGGAAATRPAKFQQARSEEHTSELQSRENLVCRLLLEKKKR